MVRVVDDEIGCGDAVGELDDFEVTVGLAADALVAVLAENHRLAVFQLEDVFAAGIALGQVEPRAIVEDVAVLQNLDVGGTLCAAACLRVSFKWLWKTSTERATKVASEPMASETGLKGRSTEQRR